jgi:hypothetical protein
VSIDFDYSRSYFPACNADLVDRPLVLIDVHLLCAGRTAVEIVRDAVEGEER